MSIDAFANKFVKALETELCTQSSQLRTYPTFRTHINTLFLELEHQKLKEYLVANIDKVSSDLWAKFCVAKNIPQCASIYSDEAFEADLKRVSLDENSLPNLIALACLPESPLSVRAALQQRLITSSLSPANILAILHHSHSTSTSSINHPIAFVGSVVEQMNCVVSILSSVDPSEIPYTSICVYINNIITHLVENTLFDHMNTSQGKFTTKQFVRSLLNMFILALQSMPVSDTSSKTFLNYVSMTLDRIPLQTISLEAHSTDFVEALLENVTLASHVDTSDSKTLPRVDLLFRLPGVLDLLLAGLFSKDDFATGSVVSPLRNPFSALRLARVLRSFTQLSPLLRKLAPVAQANNTFVELKQAVISLGKVLQKHAHHAGSFPLPSSLNSSLPALITKPTEPGLTVQVALANVSKDTFSFLLRQGQCAVSEKNLLRLIQKLRVVGLSALTTNPTEDVDAKKQKSDDGEDDDNNDDDFIGLYAENDIAEEDVNMMANDDLFYVDVDGENDIRGDIASLIEQTKDENDFANAAQLSNHVVVAEEDNDADENTNDVDEEKQVPASFDQSSIDTIARDEMPSSLENELSVIFASEKPVTKTKKRKLNK